VKRGQTSGLLAAVAGLGTVGLTALFAHAASTSPAADAGDHLFPNNSISIGSAGQTTFVVPAGVSGAPSVMCSHSTVAIKTPNTRSGAAAPYSLQVLPPAFDNGPVGAMTPAPCKDQFAVPFTVITGGHWSASAYDCPTAVTSCVEATEPNTEALVLRVPQNGITFIDSLDGCTIYVNHNSTTPFAVPATYNESSGQLQVNIRSSTAGIPATSIGNNCPPAPTPTGSSCSGQSDAWCMSWVGTYTFGGIAGFPKLTDS